MRSGGQSGAPLVSGHGPLEAFSPLDERTEEPAHALSRLLVHEVAVFVELLAGVGDEHLGFGHDVGRGVQEDLAQYHLASRRPCSSRARPDDADGLVPEGGGGPERPVEGGREHTGDGVVVLGCGYEDGVGFPDLLLQIAHRGGVALVLYVLVEEGNFPELVGLDRDALGCQLPRGADEAAVEGGTAEAARQAEYPEVVHRSPLTGAPPSFPVPYRRPLGLRGRPRWRRPRSGARAPRTASR